MGEEHEVPSLNTGQKSWLGCRAWTVWLRKFNWVENKVLNFRCQKRQAEEQISYGLLMNRFDEEPQ